MNNSLIDAMSFLFRERRTVHKAQRWGLDAAFRAGELS